MKTEQQPPAIHRFPLELTGLNKIEMPKGAIVLDVVVKAGATLHLVAMVDPTASKATRTFIMVPTGQPIPHGWDMVHLKSITGPGPMIHVFEVPSHILKKLTIS